MQLKFLKANFSVCKLRDMSKLNLASGFFFLAKTPDEISLVCPTEDVPDNITTVAHGWKAFRIEGQLDFSLVGILSRISALLASKNISVFAVSTYDTDYILINKDKVEDARAVLEENGYDVI